ncbi:MAG: cytochrome c family protein [Spirochaetota bacterium]|nr:cytochrome c family protein [Spirochaetota bacterium]
MTYFKLKAMIVIIAALSMSYCNSNGEKSTEKETEKEVKKVTLSKRFSDRHFTTVIPQLKPLEGKDGITIGVRAKDCSVCHKEIYEEWSKSTHATALQDIQYQSELAKNESPKWLCLNCHIPVQNQREYFVNKDTLIEDKGDDIRFLVKKTNPDFDPTMQVESITCAVCHIRQDEQGKSYIIGSHNSNKAPHPLKQDKKYLRNHCISCHTPTGAHLTSTFLCWFYTGDELKNGPYANKKDCVDCHMPAKKRPLVSGYPSRTVSQHHWTGGGVPKWFKDYDKLIERGYEPALKVNVKNIGEINPGKTLSVKLTYKNAKAGHWLPTGDPERFILIRATIQDNLGKEFAVEKLKFGQEWDWGDHNTGRPAKQLSDNRLKPLEEREWAFQIPLPSNITGQKLVITAYHVRLTTQTAKFMMDTKGINEKYIKDGQNLVKNADKHYPFASYVFREEVDLKTKKKKSFNLKELIELSKKEKDKKLSERVY